MSINRGTKMDIVECLRAANGLAVADLSETDLNWGTPQPIAGTWREGLTTKNSAVRVTATDASKYQGSVVVVYDRLNLAGFNSLLADFRIQAYQPATTKNLLKPLWLKYGIIIDAADLLDEPITVDPNNPYQVTLKATADALGWLGSCTITVENSGAILSDYMLTTSLPGFNYPVAGDGTSGSALMYMYPYDFSAYKSTLETYLEGQIIGAGDTALVDAIKAIDQGTGAASWNLDPASTSWSLAGATVVYSGINSNLLPTNQSYKYVLGLSLRGDVTTPPGVMYLHYNDPFDPNAI